MSYQPAIVLTGTVVPVTWCRWSIPAQRSDFRSSVRMSWT
jgi:hypothetical protein